MKVGIITQPLLNNYGGILQNFALQHILKDLGHVPVTIEYVSHYRFKVWLIYTIKTIILSILGKKRNRKFVPYYRKRNPQIDAFVRSNISITKSVKRYTDELITENNIETLVVGSDQVWRPEYNNNLYDMYLAFAESSAIPKLAYAASFGVDKLLYSDMQINKCRELINKFKAVSVREKSGVRLCKKYFDINAIEVLDPTLLLAKEEYEKLCSDIPVSENSFLASYILDVDKEKEKVILQIGANMNLSVKFFSADLNANLSIPEWLSIFRDAKFIITDSYHGTLFSIIFQKDFLVIGNLKRGLARFKSILSTLSLDDRLVDNLSNYIQTTDSINWIDVYNKLNEKRISSRKFLEANINNN